MTLRRVALVLLLVGCNKQPAPATAPESGEGSTEEVPAADAPPRFVVGPGPFDCVGIVGEGFPAISADGATVVVPAANHMAHGAASGRLGLRWLDVASGKATKTDAIAEPILLDDFDAARDCPTLREQIAERVDAINASLAGSQWHTLERLPTHLVDPPQAEEDVPTSIDSVWGDRATGTILVVEEESATESMDCTPCFRTRLEQRSPEALQALPPHPCPDAPTEPPDTCAAAPEDDEGFPRFGMSVG